MPFYEYECKKCHHRFEEIQKIDAPALTECPACHQPSLSKLVSAPAVQFTGSGWYVTDFKNPSASETKAKPTEGTGEKSSGEKS